MISELITKSRCYNKGEANCEVRRSLSLKPIVGI